MIVSLVNLKEEVMGG